MTSIDTTALYAAHPHLARIGTLWGTRQCRNLLCTLLGETRDGARHGFEPEHASTIIRILMEHDRLFPEFDDSEGGAWWKSWLDHERGDTPS